MCSEGINNEAEVKFMHLCDHGRCGAPLLKLKMISGQRKVSNPNLWISQVCLQWSLGSRCFFWKSSKLVWSSWKSAKLFQHKSWCGLVDSSSYSKLWIFFWFWPEIIFNFKSGRLPSGFRNWFSPSTTLRAGSLLLLLLLYCIFQASRPVSFETVPIPSSYLS